MMLYKQIGISKFEETKSFIDLLIDSEEKFILFAHHKDVLHLYSKHLVDKGVLIIYIDGSTP